METALAICWFALPALLWYNFRARSLLACAESEAVGAAVMTDI